MAETSEKQRISYAKAKAIKSLKETRHDIIPSDNSVFCFLAVRKKEMRLIRITIDKISDHDIKLVQNFSPPGICTKEIWCAKYKRAGFEIREIN